MAHDTVAALTPLDFAVRWYNAASEAWRRTGEDTGSDEVYPAAGHIFESYLSYAEAFSQLAQEYFSNFQPATRPDLARITGLVEALEDKVGHLDGALAELRTGYGEILSGVQSSGDALGGVERRLAQVKSSVSEQAPAVGQRLDQVDHQLGQMEKKLGRVETTTGQLQGALGDQAEAVRRRLDHVDQQLGQVEKKLGRVETAASQLQNALERLTATLEKSADARKAEGDKPATAERKGGTKHGAANGQPAEQA